MSSHGDLTTSVLEVVKTYLQTGSKSILVIIILIIHCTTDMVNNYAMESLTLGLLWNGSLL